jgi:hypothetical protein
MLDSKQRHKLLLADRTRDVAWITATIEHVLAADPTVTLAEVEAVFRDAAGHSYVIAGEPFSVVIGFAAWHSALGRLGMTAEMNRAVLANVHNVEVERAACAPIVGTPRLLDQG